jgi:endonuclease/exonuclease/phosphatase family metal-dependent hydrolase
VVKIATWNIERPSESSKERNAKIVAALKEIDADILILTETNSLIQPGEEYSSFATTSLGLLDEPHYKDGENRTTVWSKYPVHRYIKTYDSFTSICVGIRTPLGELNVYGTIIGIYGNRNESFKVDLEMQLADWRRICSMADICVAGDLNISFADNYYYTKDGRQKIDACFKQMRVHNLTREIPENIDHIAISESFLKSVARKTKVWNEDKKLSDHIGVCLSLER